MFPRSSQWPDGGMERGVETGRVELMKRKGVLGNERTDESGIEMTDCGVWEE